MRAATLKERPSFPLMRQTDIQTIYHMQMPRWLFSDPRYADMALEAKVAYTFLLNRFQLSRRNGWVNDFGEVFIIFPRKELAKELHICEQRVTAAFRTLKDLNLIWEKRCGRGDANQIYLATVTPQDDPDYEKLANISYDKQDGVFRAENLVPDDTIDVPGCCRRAEELFELYQKCANRKQIETICVNYLRGLEATKLSITGHMYFVPRTHMDKVDVFEEFIKLLGGHNRKDTPLLVNSFYIIDDEKQRAAMTEEFYAAVKKEIADYQERADYFIKSGSQSPAVMERWVLKIQALEEKKKHYEGVLRRELDGLDDEFATLKFLSQELQVRAKNIRFQKAA